jgi:hypothetical protein
MLYFGIKQKTQAIKHHSFQDLHGQRMQNKIIAIDYSFSPLF